MRNKTNFCEDGFLNYLNDILTGVEKYLNSYWVDKVQKNDRKQINCDSLSDEQIDNICKLADKTTELLNNYGNKYILSS